MHSNVAYKNVSCIMEVYVFRLSAYAHNERLSSVGALAAVVVEGGVYIL